MDVVDNGVPRDPPPSVIVVFIDKVFVDKITKYDVYWTSPAFRVVFFSDVLAIFLDYCVV